MTDSQQFADSDEDLILDLPFRATQPPLFTNLVTKQQIQASKGRKKDPHGKNVSFNPYLDQMNFSDTSTRPKIGKGRGKNGSRDQNCPGGGAILAPLIQMKITLIIGDQITLVEVDIIGLMKDNL